MKTRADVVIMPEIVALRRGVEAAYARMVEARKRDEGAAFWSSGRTSGDHVATERREATAAWERLTAEYEARVADEMKK